MKLKEELLSKFRRLQTIFSVILFILVTIFFSATADLNLKSIQISEWGTLDKTGWVFNASLVILSISTFLNSFFYIKNHNRIQNKKLLYILFFFVSFSLFITGIFNVEYNKLIHNVFAFTYFFIYPFAIFTLSHLNRKNIIYKEWLFHLCSSIVMIVFPLLFISFFDGMAIAEIIHTAAVMYWNLRLIFKI